MDSVRRWQNGTLMSRLDPATCEELLRMGVRRSVAADERVIREGQLESHVVVLHRALAKVTATMADGRQALLSIRVSGDLVGEMSALNGTPRSATVTICRPSMISIVQRDRFRAFLRQHPDAAVEIAGMVADRLRWANRRRVDFASYPVKTRLARILAEIATVYGYRVPSGVAIGIRLTQPELATLCGAAEVTLQKALRDLRRTGLVDTGYRQIIVVDLPALTELADLYDVAY